MHRKLFGRLETSENVHNIILYHWLTNLARAKKIDFVLAGKRVGRVKVGKTFAVLLEEKF